MTAPQQHEPNEIYIKVENHDHQLDHQFNHHSLPKTKVEESEIKTAEKRELPFDSQSWEILHGSNAVPFSGQILPENHLNVQSYTSANNNHNQSLKSGSPNSLNPYRVLPPVTPTGSVTAHHLVHDDFLLPPGSALSGYSGMSGLSPLQGFSPMGSTFVSPRHSAKSNSRNFYSAARKRTLSVSPLSMDGVDLSALIRISPNSLLAAGSLNTSPLPPIGSSTSDHHSTYGHLSARNLTPSNGNLSRNLLAATPASMVMQMEYPGMSTSDVYMSGAYENVLSYQNNNNNNNHKNLGQTCYANRTSFTPSSNLILHQHDPNMISNQSHHKLQSQKPYSNNQVTSSVHGHSSILSSKVNQVLSHEALCHDGFVEHPPHHYNNRTNHNKLGITHGGQHRNSPQAVTAVKTENTNHSNSTNPSQKGTTWICYWLDCNSVFKVSTNHFLFLYTIITDVRSADATSFAISHQSLLVLGSVYKIMFPK